MNALAVNDHPPAVFSLIFLIILSQIFPCWTNTAASSLSASALPAVSCKDMKTFTKGNQLNIITTICSAYTLDLGGTTGVFKAD